MALLSVVLLHFQLRIISIINVARAGINFRRSWRGCTRCWKLSAFRREPESIYRQRQTTIQMC